MPQKVFYRYNPRTEQYERVYPSCGRRVAIAVQRVATTMLMAVAFMMLLYWLVELPREKKLRQDNERLKARIEVLDRRTEIAISVMEELAERDNNFYRVFMGAEPLNSTARNAGLERQRLYDSLDSLDDGGLSELLSHKVEQLEQLVYIQSRSYDFLAEQSRTQRDRIAHIPAIQPVPERFLRTMASGYGVRRDPIYGTMKFHEGMDFSAPVGTPVYATADGRVASAGWQGLYGNLIEIDHGYNYKTRYAHLSQVKVRAGQTVHRGDLIGLVGNTGKSTGPHLHYEVRLRGQAQNPVNYYYFDLSPEQYDEIIAMAENAGHVMD